jgi:hypothetical protein
MTRAKMRCTQAGTTNGYLAYVFSAVTDDGTPENERYHKYTPSGSLHLSVDNPNVSFEEGREYYVDITPA